MKFSAAHEVPTALADELAVIRDEACAANGAVLREFVLSGSLRLNVFALRVHEFHYRRGKLTHSSIS
jgi:hypothetical protein